DDVLLLDIGQTAVQDRNLAVFELEVFRQVVLQRVECGDAFCEDDDPGVVLRTDADFAKVVEQSPVLAGLRERFSTVVLDGFQTVGRLVAESAEVGGLSLGHVSRLKGTKTAEAVVDGLNESLGAGDEGLGQSPWEQTGLP